MPRLFIDLETYCDLDLRDVTPYAYAAHPSFRILLGGWSLDGGPVHVLRDQDDVLAIPGLFDPSVTKVAHNAPFERVTLSAAAGAFDGSLCPPEQWDDTMARAAEHGYPAGLGELARWLGAAPKDEAGTRLINLFCKPRRDGGRNGPETHPQEWDAFVRYLVQDVETLVDVDRMLPGWPTPAEREAWVTDQRINDRGVRVDLDLARAAHQAATDNALLAEVEVMHLTGVSNPGSQPQMLRWFRTAGGLPDLPSLRSEVLGDVARRDDLTPLTRRVLELRGELALVASKKFAAALDGASPDGRLRGQFRFFGAHTGRWAGRGVQLHNMPREQFVRVDPATGAKEHDAEAEAATIVDLLIGSGADPVSLKKAVRAMLVGPFTVVDYSAIEARVVAWLAGEQWALDAFAAGRDIYVETAQRMSTPSHPLGRSEGKVAVLALGYNGAVNSLRQMGAEGTDDHLVRLVRQWREANPRIVQFWRDLDTAFRVGGPVGEHVAVERDGDTRRVRLPSGRAVTYHGCSWRWVDSARGRKREASFLDPKKGGARARTYGGKLTENVTQAVARDLLAAALVRLEAAGLPVVAHVHDEVIVEGARSVHDVAAVMTDSPAWAAGLPVSAEGFTCERYRKG